MNHYYPQVPSALPAPNPSDVSRLQQYAGTYESNRHTYTRFGKSVTPNPQVEIMVTPNGYAPEFHQRPCRGSRSPARCILPLDGVRPASGDIVFHTAADGTVDYFCLGNMPFLVYDRVPWYATAGFVENLRTAAGNPAGDRPALAAALCIPQSLCDPGTTGTERGPDRTLDRGSCRTSSAFAGVLLPAVTADQGLIHSYLFDQAGPVLLTAVLTVPVIGAVLTGLTVICTALAWKRKFWTLPHLLHYTIIAIALVAMLWWVNFWNLWVFCL